MDQILHILMDHQLINQMGKTEPLANSLCKSRAFLFEPLSLLPFRVKQRKHVNEDRLTSLFRLGLLFFPDRSFSLSVRKQIPDEQRRPRDKAGTDSLVDPSPIKPPDKGGFTPRRPSRNSWNRSTTSTNSSSFLPAENQRKEAWTKRAEEAKAGKGQQFLFQIRDGIRMPKTEACLGPDGTPIPSDFRQCPYDPAWCKKSSLTAFHEISSW